LNPPEKIIGDQNIGTYMKRDEKNVSQIEIKILMANRKEKGKK
jgi:hypothetical protein